MLVAYFYVPVCDGVSQWAVIQLPIRGELADFMKTSKAISDAAEQYMEDTRQAKTNRIRSDSETHEKLQAHHAGVAGKSGRSAAQRKKGKGGSKEGVKVKNPMAEPLTTE